jgi:hypothetical protein
MEPRLRASMNQSYVASIICPAHFSHGSGDDIPFLELATGSVFD